LSISLNIFAVVYNTQVKSYIFTYETNIYNKKDCPSPPPMWAEEPSKNPRLG